MISIKNKLLVLGVEGSHFRVPGFVDTKPQQSKPPNLKYSMGINDVRTQVRTRGEIQLVGRQAHIVPLFKVDTEHPFRLTDPDIGKVRKEM